MIRRVGTPVFANSWWLVPVIGADTPTTGEPLDVIAHSQKSASLGAALDADLIFEAFPLSSSRKLKHSADVDCGFAIIAARAVMIGARRHELEHLVVLREQAGRIEARFGGSAPSSDARREICVALGERLLDALEHRVPDQNFGISPSNWTIEEVLAVLREYPRLDDGVDQLALRVGSRSSDRAMYVYLYGLNPAQIHFDLEDMAAGSEQWDGSVARGSVTTVDRLALVAREWLDNGALYTGAFNVA